MEAHDRMMKAVCHAMRLNASAKAGTREPISPEVMLALMDQQGMEAVDK